MAQPILKVKCIDKNNPLYGFTALGQIRLIPARTIYPDLHPHSKQKELAFCVQVDDEGWHPQLRYQWENINERPQTTNKQRPNSKPRSNLANERVASHKNSRSSKNNRTEYK